MRLPTLRTSRNFAAFSHGETGPDFWRLGEVEIPRALPSALTWLNPSSAVQTRTRLVRNRNTGPKTTQTSPRSMTLNDETKPGRTPALNRHGVSVLAPNDARLYFRPELRPDEHGDISGDWNRSANDRHRQMAYGISCHRKTSRTASAPSTAAFIDIKPLPFVPAYDKCRAGCDLPAVPYRHDITNMLPVE